MIADVFFISRIGTPQKDDYKKKFVTSFLCCNRMTGLRGGIDWRVNWNK